MPSVDDIIAGKNIDTRSYRVRGVLVDVLDIFNTTENWVVSKYDINELKQKIVERNPSFEAKESTLYWAVRQLKVLGELSSIKAYKILWYGSHQSVSMIERSIPSLATSSPELLERVLLDINWLLVEGFDTNADDCEISGVRDTIAEIKQAIAKTKGE